MDEFGQYVSEIDPSPPKSGKLQGIAKYTFVLLLTTFTPSYMHVYSVVQILQSANPYSNSAHKKFVYKYSYCIFVYFSVSHRCTYCL